MVIISVPDMPMSNSCAVYRHRDEFGVFWGDLFCKFLAKIVCNTINFRNFTGGKLCPIFYL
jgi:hypothetical protein